MADQEGAIIDLEAPARLAHPHPALRKVVSLRALPLGGVVGSTCMLPVLVFYPCVWTQASAPQTAVATRATGTLKTERPAELSTLWISKRTTCAAGAMAGINLTPTAIASTLTEQESQTPTPA